MVAIRNVSPLYKTYAEDVAASKHKAQDLRLSAHSCFFSASVRRNKSFIDILPPGS